MFLQIVVIVVLGTFQRKADMIRGNIDVVGQLLNCRKCQRKILVEEGLVGVSHTVTKGVICWDCLTKGQQANAKKLYSIHPSNLTTIFMQKGER